MNCFQFLLFKIINNIKKIKHNLSLLQAQRNVNKFIFIEHRYFPQGMVESRPNSETEGGSGI